MLYTYVEIYSIIYDYLYIQILIELVFNVKQIDMKMNSLLIGLTMILFAGCSTDEDIHPQTNENDIIVTDSEERVLEAILAYQKGANSKNIDTYMSAFADEITILDVTREINGKDNVRTWAINEVIPHGETFKHRRILEQSEGYAKTEVNWLSWVVHYYYWWDKENKITRMSLQYAN